MKTFKNFIETKSDRPASERGAFMDLSVAKQDRAVARGSPPKLKATSGREQKFSIKTIQNIAKDKRNVARDVMFKDGNVISLAPQAAEVLLKLNKKMSKGWDQRVKTATAFNKILKIASKL